MIPFPGESVGAFDAWSSTATGYNLWREITRRGGIGDPTTYPGHETLAAGDEWRVWMFGDDLVYLEDTPDVAISWVVEVLSGSGVVQVSELLDDYTQSIVDDYPTDLPDITVTGAGTYVVASTLTLAEVTDGDMSPAVRLIGASGSIVVQQVKLRVWPVDGPLGAWVEQDPWTAASSLSILAGAATPDFAAVSDPFALEADAWADLDDKMPAAYSSWAGASKTIDLAPAVFGSGDPRLEVQGTIGMELAGGINDEAYADAGLGVAMIYGPDLTDADAIDYTALTFGTDFIAPPGEVYSDTRYRWQRDTSPTFDWPAFTMPLSLELDCNGTPPTNASGLSLTTWSATLPDDAYDGVPIAITGATVPLGAQVISTDVEGSFSTTVSIPAGTPGQGLFLSLVPSFVQDLPDFSHWIASGLGSNFGTYLGVMLFEDGTLPALTVQNPTYRVWDPTAVAVARIPLQWNQRPDQLGLEGAALWQADLTGHHRAQWRGTI